MHTVVTDKLEVSDGNGQTTTVEQKMVVESTGPSQVISSSILVQTITVTVTVPFLCVESDNDAGW